MQAQSNNVYIANPIDILHKLDSDQFDLVYLDPPYFESNIFNKSDIKSPYQNFEEYLEYVVGIIFQSQRVLIETGSILLRTDPLSIFNARLFLDRVFGKQNFRAEIIWERRIIQRLGNLIPHANFESLFFYSKTENFVYNEQTKEISPDEIKKQYRHKDKKGPYKLWPLTDRIERSERLFEWNGYSLPKGQYWKYSKARLFELNHAGEIDITGKFPRRKMYLSNESRSTPLGSIWNDFSHANIKRNQLDLRIQTAIEMASRPDAKILCIFTDLITLNTIQKSNLENAGNRQWVGITPFNVVAETIIYGTKKSNPYLPSYLINSEININVITPAETQETINRGDLPNRIRNLIKAETQSVDPNSLPKSVGQKYAFLVGINRYTTGIGDLHYCVQDAIELGQVFQNLGYQTKMLHDESEEVSLYPNKSNIEDELIDWVQSLNQEDTLYVHFSGHGTIADESAVILTSDTRKKKIIQTALDIKNVIAIINSGRARKRILSLDICHGGTEMGRALIDQEFIQNVYEKAEGFVLLAASTARQQAYETHEHKHGLFTYFLIQGLSGDADRNEDGIITVNDLKDYTLDQVRRWNTLNGGTQEPTFKAEGIGDIPLVIQ